MRRRAIASVGLASMECLCRSLGGLEAWEAWEGWEAHQALEEEAPLSLFHKGEDP